MPAHVHTPAVLITICSKMVTDAGGQTMEAEGATLLQGVDELPWMGVAFQRGQAAHRSCTWILTALVTVLEKLG